MVVAAPGGGGGRRLIPSGGAIVWLFRGLGGNKVMPDVNLTLFCLKYDSQVKALNELAHFNQTSHYQYIASSLNEEQ